MREDASMGDTPGRNKLFRRRRPSWTRLSPTQAGRAGPGARMEQWRG